MGEIKSFNILRYRLSINKVTGITSFYKSCLKSWYDINAKYRVNNQAELDKEFIYLNPRILNDRRECYNPPNIHPNYRYMHELPRTINDFQRLGIRTRKEGLYQYLREIKTKVDSLQNEQSELVGFTFYLVDEDKEICAKLISAKELYLIILS